MPESGPYRIRKALASRTQFETVAVPREESQSRFPFHGRNMAADCGGGDTQFGTRGRQISVSGGHFEDDQSVEGR